MRMPTISIVCAVPGFKLACGRLPDSGDDLCSQPTISRWENAPTRHEVAAMSYAMIDIYCASYARPPREVTRRCCAWRTATLAVQHASRRTMLSTHPCL